MTRIKRPRNDLPIFENQYFLSHSVHAKYNKPKDCFEIKLKNHGKIIRSTTEKTKSGTMQKISQYKQSVPNWKRNIYWSKSENEKMKKRASSS